MKIDTIGFKSLEQQEITAITASDGGGFVWVGDADGNLFRISLFKHLESDERQRNFTIGENVPIIKLELYTSKNYDERIIVTTEQSVSIYSIPQIRYPFTATSILLKKKTYFDLSFSLLCKLPISGKVIETIAFRDSIWVITDKTITWFSKNDFYKYRQLKCDALPTHATPFHNGILVVYENRTIVYYSDYRSEFVDCRHYDDSDITAIAAIDTNHFAVAKSKSILVWRFRSPNEPIYVQGTCEQPVTSMKVVPGSSMIVAFTPLELIFWNPLMQSFNSHAANNSLNASLTIKAISSKAIVFSDSENSYFMDIHAKTISDRLPPFALIDFIPNHTTFIAVDANNELAKWSI